MNLEKNSKKIQSTMNLQKISKKIQSAMNFENVFYWLEDFEIILNS